MKVKISMVAATLILSLILVNHPPKVSKAQDTLDCVAIKDTSVKLVLGPEATKAIDSLKSYACQVDCVTVKCKKRLNLLNRQQKQLILQVNKLDTLSTLITKE